MLSFIIKLLNKWLKHRKLLRQFYIEIYTWVVDGCPGHPVFKKQAGLCSTLEMWCYYQGCQEYTGTEVRMLLQRQFIRAGLSKSYPFNAPDTRIYYDELDKGTLYENPRRIQWLHDHALQSLW